MKTIIIGLIVVFTGFSLSAQDTQKQTRKQRRANREAAQKEMVKTVLNNKNFVFNATHVLPLGGTSRYMNYDYDVTVRNDSVFSYLPYFGVAYHIEYGSTKGGFQFDLPLEKYKFEKNKNEYRVSFEVKNKNDVIDFNFSISETGYTTLTVNSVNRQSISYYGIIEAPEDKK